MPEAAQPALRSGKSASGFTLIEVLVIVIIIGIVSAVVLLSFGILGDDRSLQQQGRRISSLITLAADEALMQGRDFGIEFTRGGYRFLEFDALTNRWHEVVGDDLLRPRQVEKSLELELELEDREVALGDRFTAAVKDDDDDDNDKGEESSEPALADDFSPHILILSSGDISPFLLRIVRPSDRSELVVDMSPEGEMEIQTAAEAAR